MSSVERVTVTLPGVLVREMDRHEKNRSRFMQEAVRRELDRRRREELRRSLQDVHAESEELAEIGLGEWSDRLPEEAASELVDLTKGRAVRWIQGEGWVETDE